MGTLIVDGNIADGWALVLIPLAPFLWRLFRLNVSFTHRSLLDFWGDGGGVGCMYLFSFVNLGIESRA